MRKPQHREIWKLKTGDSYIVVEENKSRDSVKLYNIAQKHRLRDFTFTRFWNDKGEYFNTGQKDYDLSEYLGTFNEDYTEIDKGETFAKDITPPKVCKHNWKPTTVSKDSKEWCTLCGEKK